MNSPCLLAFDTSTEHLAVAVVSPQAVWVHHSLGGAMVSSTLLPQVQRLLGLADLKFSDLCAIAFGAGPGAFTGLRSSCAVAQGLAFGLGCPVLPIDSLLIVAEDARWQACCGVVDDPSEPCSDDGMLGSASTQVPSFEVNVVMDARMDEAYAGRYLHNGQHWQVLQAPALYTLPALEQAWAPLAIAGTSKAGDETLRTSCMPAWLAGSALSAFGARLRLPAGLRHLQQEQDRAGALARLALQAWNQGAAIDAASALPLYLRDKVAFTTDEREAIRQAAAVSAGEREPGSAAGLR